MPLGDFSEFSEAAIFAQGLPHGMARKRLKKVQARVDEV